MQPYAVVDLDGVVADVRHRLHHLDRRPKDWAGFFRGAGDDPLLAEGAAVVHRLADDHEVVYLSGRPERLRAVTQTWLEREGLPDGCLLLRPDRDFRPARVMKVQVLRELARERPVDVLVDDDVAVVAAARSAGFAVLEADWARDAPTEPTLFEAQERDGRT